MGIISQNWASAGQMFSKISKFLPGWTLRVENETFDPAQSPQFIQKVKQKLNNLEDFLLMLQTPTYMQGLFPDLHAITGHIAAGEDLTPSSQGRVLVGMRSAHKLTLAAQRLLAAV